MSVLYYTEYNHTKTLAEAIADGARQVSGVDVTLLPISDADVTADVLLADAVVIGAPVHFGNVAAGLLTWVEDEWSPYWQTGNFSGKLGGIFTTGGGIAQGIEHVLASLHRTLMSYNFKVVTPDATKSGYASYGVMAITGTAPFNLTGGAIAECFVEPAQTYGAQIASATVTTKRLEAKCGTAK